MSSRGRRGLLSRRRCNGRQEVRERKKKGRRWTDLELCLVHDASPLLFPICTESSDGRDLILPAPIRTSGSGGGGGGGGGDPARFLRVSEGLVAVLEGFGPFVPACDDIPPDGVALCRSHLASGPATADDGSGQGGGAVQPRRDGIVGRAAGLIEEALEEGVVVADGGRDPRVSRTRRRRGGRLGGGGGGRSRRG